MSIFVFQGFIECCMFWIWMTRKWLFLNYFFSTLQQIVKITLNLLIFRLIFWKVNSLTTVHKIWNVGSASPSKFSSYFGFYHWNANTFLVSAACQSKIHLEIINNNYLYLGGKLYIFDLWLLNKGKGLSTPSVRSQMIPS